MIFSYLRKCRNGLLASHSGILCFRRCWKVNQLDFLAFSKTTVYDKEPIPPYTAVLSPILCCLYSSQKSFASAILCRMIECTCQSRRWHAQKGGNTNVSRPPANQKRLLLCRPQLQTPGRVPVPEMDRHRHSRQEGQQEGGRGSPDRIPHHIQ